MTAASVLVAAVFVASFASSLPPTAAEPHGSCDVADGDGSGEGGHCHHPRLVVRPVARVDAAELTIEDFKLRYSPSDRTAPLVITGMGARTGEAIDPSRWTRSALRELCGDVPLILTKSDGTPIDGCGERILFAERSGECHKVRHVEPDLVGEEWAGLWSTDLKKWRIDTMADLIDRQDDPEDEGGRRLYLHDAMMIHYCPPALDLLPGVPKYFRRDYEVLNDDPVFVDIAPDGDDFWSEYKDFIHFPSLFVGKGGGAGSPLHADVGLTRFWKLQLSGRKQWRVVSPSDNHRVYPTHPSARWGSEGSALYNADLFSPDFDAHPLLDGLVVFETIAEPGDVLFLPEGWPHQVRNLDDSVSVAYNFVDNDNLEAVREFQQWDLNAAGEMVEDDYTAALFESFFLPLDDPPLRRIPLTDGSGEVEADFVPFRQFFSEQNLRTMTELPSSALKFVEERRRAVARVGGGFIDGAALAAAVGAYRDRFDRPPLHVAAVYHHLPLLKYLLDEVGVDPLLQDGHGWTALYVLEEVAGLKDGVAAEILKRHMEKAREKERKSGKKEMRPTEEMTENRTLHEDNEAAR